jgi:FlaG/FlaF family flagellin (archaellin)
MKGISTIIATIIMVVITIGLIGVAYLYMSGLISGRTATNIQLADAYCRGTLFMLIKNIGTTSIATQINVVIRGQTVAAASITCNPAFPLGAGNTTMCSNTTLVNLVTGPNEIRIIGPSNAVGGTINC